MANACRMNEELVLGFIRGDMWLLLGILIQTLFGPLVNKFVLHKSSIFKFRSQRFTALNRISGLVVGIAVFTERH